MADSPPPAPAPPPPLAPTTITALNDDILRDIFLRLPDVMTLARAAFACHAFLRAVRSSPAFRRRFRELHAPPLLALFQVPDMRAVVPAAAGKGTYIAAAFDGLLQDSGASQWRSDPYPEISFYDGYAYLVNLAIDQTACYSPLSQSQALNIYPKNVRYIQHHAACLEFYTLSPEGEEQRPSRVVCVHHGPAWVWARVAVFSLQTMEWQVVLPEIRELLPDSLGYNTGRVVGGFVCWMDETKGYILALDAATFQFSRMDLPSSIERIELGQTKDGELCLVGVLKLMLSVWLWAADDDGVRRFMLHKMVSLRTNVSKVAELSEEDDVGIGPMAVISGFVYLSAYIRGPWAQQRPEWFLSFCMETNEMNLLYKASRRLFYRVDPYIMVSWPSSLINGKEDTETGVAGNILKDDGHMGTKEASPVLFTALQSFKETLIGDGNSNFAEIDSFLLDDERNSLLNRIATLELRLAAARDRVLRIGTEPNSMSGIELVTSESELATAIDCVLRIGTECNSKE